MRHHKLSDFSHRPVAYYYHLLGAHHCYSVRARLHCLVDLRLRHTAVYRQPATLRHRAHNLPVLWVKYIWIMSRPLLTISMEEVRYLRPSNELLQV